MRDFIFSYFLHRACEFLSKSCKVESENPTCFRPAIAISLPSVLHMSLEINRHFLSNPGGRRSGLMTPSFKFSKNNMVTAHTFSLKVSQVDPPSRGAFFDKTPKPKNKHWTTKEAFDDKKR